MKLVKTLILSALGMWAIEATAQTPPADWAFVDRPAIFTRDYPARVECSQKSLSYLVCMPPNVPGTIRTLAQDMVTGRQFVTKLTGYAVAECKNGYCNDLNSDLYLGRGPIVSQGSYQVKIPFGYYLALDRDDEYLVAWKFGHGPEYQNFPEFVFLSEERSAGTSERSGNGRPPYPVSCWPSEDTCSYFNGERYVRLEREELPQYIPMLENTDGVDCQFELCMDGNGDTVGLNPDYHLWDE